MFSEYASRFLAQSGITFDQNDPSSSRSFLERQRGPPRAPSRGYLQRQPQGNPYASIQASRFPFASRLSTNNTPAPLFYSATDEFREDDDNAEHEREVADFYALQRSRRAFDAGHMTDSSDLDEDSSRHNKSSGKRTARGGEASNMRGIRSSWTGDETNIKSTHKEISRDRVGKPSHLSESEISNDADLPRNKMVDVELASTIDEENEDDPPHDMAVDLEDDPPSIQQLRRTPVRPTPMEESSYIPRETDGMMSRSRMQSPDRESIPATLAPPSTEPPRHDAFWATLFLLCLASTFATFILVFLHTNAPENETSLGDTIYTTLHKSFYLLAVDTVVAIFIALLWLATLRSFVKPLVFGIVLGVPVVLFVFSAYPFISSFKGNTVQDKAMRWFSFLPVCFGFFWSYTAYRGRHSFARAIGLLEFATRILAASPALVVVGFGTLAAVISWTWLWLLMFTRVFLGGRVSASSHTFVINGGTWWLGIFFVLTYLWTLAVISGIQRSTTAATVSQWYFHRLTVPAPSSQRVVLASFTHATTTVFGTICFSTLLALAIRLPLLVLPARLSSTLAFAFYSLVPTSIATLTNPLTMTYAAIHSQPLNLSARGLSEMSFISATSPTTTLTPRAFSQKHNASGHAPLLAYRLAKLFLYATRAVTALAFGFGGWVSTARMLHIAGSRGSLYAYIVGLAAGAIGWGVLGAMEGVLTGVLDAVVVCWGSEIGIRGGGQARYCREAAELLEEEDGAVQV